jgi:hypothetical protein
VGDWFQIIADIEATADEAEELGTAILSWLIDTGVVLAEAGAGGGPADQGHPPGPRYASAVIEPRDVPELLTLRPNGVLIDAKIHRTVFFSMGADHVTCPRCAHVVVLRDDGPGPPTDAWNELARTIDVWYGGGASEHPCPNCRHLVGLNDWEWSPPWGFGHLGIMFWNWPRLSPDFLAEVSQRLGHRTVHPYGKM